MVLEVLQVLLIYLFWPEWFGPTQTIGADYLCEVSTFTHDQDVSPLSQFALVGPTIYVVWNNLVGDKHHRLSLLVL